MILRSFERFSGLDGCLRGVHGSLGGLCNGDRELAYAMGRGCANSSGVSGLFVCWSPFLARRWPQSGYLDHRCWRAERQVNMNGSEGRCDSAIAATSSRKSNFTSVLHFTLHLSICLVPATSSAAVSLPQVCLTRTFKSNNHVKTRLITARLPASLGRDLTHVSITRAARKQLLFQDILRMARRISPTCILVRSPSLSLRLQCLRTRP